MIAITNNGTESIQVVQHTEEHDEHGCIILGPPNEAWLIPPGETSDIEDWRIGISYLMRPVPL